MYAISWVPGTNLIYDKLFDDLRQKRFLNSKHRLNKNYGQNHFKNVNLLTISFDNNNKPKFCSSVVKKDCWPNNVYRILNRLWKIDLHNGPLPNLSKEGQIMVYSQIQWLKVNTDCKLHFISREGDYWQKFVVNEYKNRYRLDFNFDDYKYQTCVTPNDDSCWQKIIYQGDSDLLQYWNKK